MVRRYHRIDADLINDRAIQNLTPKQFKNLLLLAIFDQAPHDNPFLDFVDGPFIDDGRPPIAEWRVIRARIFARDDYTCGYCGRRDGRLECDHIVPVSRGGSNEDDNLVTACRSCNRAKHAKLVEEWGR